MRHQESKGWFIFSFDESDKKRYGLLRINSFIAELRGKIPVEDRNYYDENNEWQIKDKYKELFQRLVQKHLRRDQLSLFK